ncbi:lysozyme family protein [Tuberibacillus sp. Marseille-P3662]|uniref:lysozyme family protein n=1 Tax=Tuberibacillus sp. Marseille-P3662 TaxID=1965358 RepID=UPI000A1C7F1F|nr:lysozyme family protein [Tuberibacillus sp. Marseille-P3662]
MKQTSKKSSPLATWLVLLLIIFTIGGVINSHSGEPDRNKRDRFENVKDYQPMIEKILAKHDLEKYTPVILALMQQESRGKGGDPMQASESAGLAPGSIDNPRKSIRQGIQHFQSILERGKRRQVDFSTIMQAYNFGPGYIDYVAKHGGEHSEALAKKFSMMQVKRKPELYDCGGDKSNFRYPYCYGDFTYSTKVNRYIESLEKSTPVNASPEAAN